MALGQLKRYKDSDRNFFSWVLESKREDGISSCIQLSFKTPWPE